MKHVPCNREQYEREYMVFVDPMPLPIVFLEKSHTYAAKSNTNIYPTDPFTKDVFLRFVRAYGAIEEDAILRVIHEE